MVPWSFSLFGFFFWGKPKASKLKLQKQFQLGKQEEGDNFYFKY